MTAGFDVRTKTISIRQPDSTKATGNHQPRAVSGESKSSGRRAGLGGKRTLRWRAGPMVFGDFQKGRDQSVASSSDGRSGLGKLRVPCAQERTGGNTKRDGHEKIRTLFRSVVSEFGRRNNQTYHKLNGGGGGGDGNNGFNKTCRPPSDYIVDRTAVRWDRRLRLCSWSSSDQ